MSLVAGFIIFSGPQYASAHEQLPQANLQLSARSILGTNRFLFKGNNGFVTEQLVTENEGQIQTGATQRISGVDPITSIEVLDPAPYFVSEINCSGIDRSAVSYSKLEGRISIQTSKMNPSQTLQCEFVFELALPSMTIEVTSGDSAELNSPFSVEVSNTGNVPIKKISLPQSNNMVDNELSNVDETLSQDDEPVGDSSDNAKDGTWDVLGPGDSIRFTSTPKLN